MDFKVGHTIDTQKNHFVFKKLLGEGGFGAVYLVEGTNQKGVTKEYAMKIEKYNEKKRHSKLKMEIFILKEVANSEHFTKIIDRGKRDNQYFFLVMELVGKCLGDIRKEMNRPFSFACGISVGFQCLEGVEELHRHGFIHRDLKPDNYAVGVGEKKHVIYILDFGIARKYINKKDELKTPREKVGFKGTVRYAPLSCHRGIELGPKDDVESLLYLVIELLSSSGLPWRRERDKKMVQAIKEECRDGRRNEFLSGILRKDELSKVLDYIDKLAYQDKVDYNYLYKMFEETCRQADVDINGPYDWEVEKEEETRPEKTSKVSKERARTPNGTSNENCEATSLAKKDAPSAFTRDAFSEAQTKKNSRTDRTKTDRTKTTKTNRMKREMFKDQEVLSARTPQREPTTPRTCSKGSKDEGEKK